MDAIGELTAEELRRAKDYFRVDGDEEDDLIAACVLSARAYLRGAGVAPPGEDGHRRALYDLVCWAIAMSAYDRREMTLTGQSVGDNPVLRRMLTQLKWTEPENVSNLDTSGEGEENHAVESA